jgi:hypothetical protein
MARAYRESIPTAKETDMFRKTTVIATALATAGTLAIAVGPASAISRDYHPISDEPEPITRTLENTNTTPVDEDGKKSCGDKWGDYHPHGTRWTLTWTNSDGKVITDTMVCDDGQWKPESSFVSSGYHDAVDVTNYYEQAP